MNRIPFLALVAIAAIASGRRFLATGPPSHRHDQPTGTMYDGHTMFNKLVEERSAGRLNVELFSQSSSARGSR